MEYVQLTLEDYQQTKEAIKQDLGGIVKSFVRIGWRLARISATKAYEMDGYRSVAEFAKTEYDMTPDGVSRFISVYEKYSVPGDTPELQEQYRKFNFSQLSEMLKIPEDDYPMILPDAKRENIREMKRFNKENENNPDNLLTWKQEEQENDGIRDTIEDFFRMNEETTNRIFSSKYWKEQNLKELVEIINPSGNRSYRKGKVFLMMYSLEQGIKVNEFGKGKRDLAWEDFFGTVREIFGEHIDGSRTHGKHFGGNDEQKQDYGKPSAEKKKPGEQEHMESENGGADRAESEIAPAQKQAECVTPEETEQLPGQMSIQDYLEMMPKPTANEKKAVYGSRRDYLKTLGTYALAIYIAAAASETDYERLTEADFWDRWMREKVDEEGEAV